MEEVAGGSVVKLTGGARYGAGHKLISTKDIQVQVSRGTYDRLTAALARKKSRLSLPVSSAATAAKLPPKALK